MAVVLVLACSAAQAQYADPKLCADCHPDAARAYQQTGMGRSFYRPSAQTLPTSASYDHPASGATFRIFERNGGWFHLRTTPDFQGRPAFPDELRIDYVIGSGNHSRTFLHRTTRGALIELPLSWYSEEGGIYAMSPGFDSPRPPTRRLISYECMFCHTGYPSVPAGHEAPGAEPLFTGDIPEGIDCQRCHGPGKKHVEAAQRGVAAAELRATIVNPARLNPKLRMDVCLQCHLEPTSTAMPSVVRRFDRSPFSFKPGEALSSFLLTFDHAPGTPRDDKFEIVGSAAYRLMKSRCYMESKGALTCSTCHSPHKPIAGNEAATHFAGTCRTCHAAALDALVARNAHPTGNDCVACHMPKRRTEDVVHVAMTDHLIQRRPPTGNLLAALPERHPKAQEEYRGEVVPYLPRELAKTGIEGLYRGFAQVAMANNLPGGLSAFARLLAALQPREPEWQIQLAEAYLAAGQPREALAACEAALRLRPGSARVLQLLAKAAQAAGQTPRALTTLSAASAAAGASASLLTQFATLQLEAGHPAEAIAALTRARALDPELPGTSVTLAQAYLASGQLSQAAASLNDGLRLDPFDSTAWDVAGRLAATRGNWPEALWSFEQAIRLRPESASHIYDYALALSSAGDAAGAMAQAERAIHADGKLPDAHVLRGSLLARANRYDDAVTEYVEALRLKPGLPRTRLDLAAIYLAQNKVAEAREQLRQVAAQSADAEAAKTAATTLSQLPR